MNLYDLVTRKDINLAISPGVMRHKQELFGQLWRGLALSPGAEFRLFDVLRFYPLKSWPDSCGWYLNLDPRACDFELSFFESRGEKVLSTRRFRRGDGFVPAQLPWPLNSSRTGPMDL